MIEFGPAPSVRVTRELNWIKSPRVFRTKIRSRSDGVSRDPRSNAEFEELVAEYKAARPGLQVAPGYIDTEMTRALPEQARQAFLTHVAMQRPGKPEEVARVVNEAIEALSYDLRQAVVLREIEGLSYEEIAQVMNCPVGTVRSRIFRARESIAERLRPLLETSKDKRW